MSEKGYLTDYPFMGLLVALDGIRTAPHLKRIGLAVRQAFFYGNKSHNYSFSGFSTQH